MLFKKLPTLFIAVLAMIAMVSCKKSNTQGRHIPANASMVMHINGAAINQKLPWEEIKKNELFVQMYADTSLSPMAKAALDNPENTGVDISNDFVFYTVNDSAGNYAVFAGAIKDAAKFKAYNTEVLKNATAAENNGLSFLHNSDVAVSWNDKQFMVLSNVPNPPAGYPEVPWLDSTLKQIDTLQPAVSKPARNLVQTATDIYALSEGNSLAKNEHFSKLFANKGDLHFYVNAEKMAHAKMNVPGIQMVDISKLTQGAVSTGVANFENGKIDVDMMFYAGKEMTNLWKKYAGTKISEDMLKRVPATDIAVLMAMNFKPEGLKELLKLLGLEGWASLGAPMLGFTLDDFVKANKGDLLLSISNLKADSSGKTNGDMFFATAVNDKASFDKLVNAGKKFGPQISGKIKSPLYFNYSDQYFALGNQQAIVDQFVTRSAGAVPAAVTPLSSGPVAGYINLQYIIKANQAMAKQDSVEQAIFTAAAATWNNILISGGEFKNGGLSQQVEINMVNQSVNSLKQLNSFMGTVGKLASHKKAQQNGNITEIRVAGTPSPANDSTALYE